MTEEETRALEKLNKEKKRVMKNDPRYQALIAHAREGQSPENCSYWLEVVSDAYMLGVDVGVITGMGLSRVMDAELAREIPKGQKNRYQ